MPNGGTAVGIVGTVEMAGRRTELQLKSEPHERANCCSRSIKRGLQRRQPGRQAGKDGKWSNKAKAERDCDFPFNENPNCR